MKNRFTTAAALAIAFVVGSGSLCAAAPVKMVVVLKTLSSQYWKIVASGACLIYLAVLFALAIGGVFYPFPIEGHLP